ncbi:MAG: winged helix-turn-helix domain-containing protein [Candidatus Aenigmatarchaeota archaeon]
MELDKNTLKALASDRKAAILKSLKDRRKTVAELSKELNLAPSTTTEHVKHLESLQLIRRIKSENKWVYFELADKGKSLVIPSYSTRIVLMLSLSFIMIIIGFAGLFMSGTRQSLASNSYDTKAAEAILSTNQQIPINISPSIFPDALFYILILIGIIILLYITWRLPRQKK